MENNDVIFRHSFEEIVFLGDNEEISRRFATLSQMLITLANGVKDYLPLPSGNDGENDYLKGNTDIVSQSPSTFGNGS